MKDLEEIKITEPQKTVDNRDDSGDSSGAGDFGRNTDWDIPLA